MEGTQGQPSAARVRTLTELAQRIEAVEHRHSSGAVSEVHAGLPAPCAVLPRGVLHEWLCSDDGRGRAWTPPLGVFIHLAHRALGDASSLVVWIGRGIWPQAHALAHTSRRLLDHSLLIDPMAEHDGGSHRLWTIDLCLRSAAVAVVIADASGMQLAHSRRLQLAAESGRALTLLARPNHEQSILSAAPLRWRIDRARSPTSQPRWNVELVRCKGVQRCHGRDANASLVLERDRATGCLCVPADMADRPAQASVAAGRVSARQTA
jgi:hypothetical protein